MQKETPYGEKVSRKSVYSIEDNMFRFWYRFVPQNLSSINQNLPDIAYRRIEPHLPDYMGSVFEEICKQYLWRSLASGNSPIDFTTLGRWWGTNPRKKKMAEIDIMGTDEQSAALFGECKWKNEKVDLEVLMTLVERSELFHYEQKYYYLFSKTGFTEGCIQKAVELGNVNLIAFSDMV